MMQEVDIYTYSNAKGLKKRAAVGYVLSVKTSVGEVTKESIEMLEDITILSSELIVLIKALKRMKKQCRLNIFTEEQFIATAFEKKWVEKWKKNDWKNAKGQEVANKEEWEELAKEINKHEVTFYVKEKHQYKRWLATETERKEKEDV